jgi:hypothetical protein
VPVAPLLEALVEVDQTLAERAHGGVVLVDVYEERMELRADSTTPLRSRERTDAGTVCPFATR